MHPIVKLCISFHNCRYSGVWTAIRYKRLPPHANLMVWFIYTHPSGGGKLSWWKAHIFLQGNKNELNYLSPASHSCNSEKCRKINQLWTWKWYLRKYFIRRAYFLQNTDDKWMYISQTEVKSSENLVVSAIIRRKSTQRSLVKKIIKKKKPCLSKHYN